MNYKKIIPAAIGFYLVFLVLLAPAAWWLKLVSLPAQVQLGPVTGTLWQGQVQAVSLNGYVLPQVNWQLKPWAFLMGKVALDLDIGQIRQTTLPYAKAQLSYGFSGLQLQSSQLRLPVEPIVPLLKLRLPFQVAASGNMLLNIQDFSMGQPWCEQLAGKASWLEAKFQAPSGWIDLKAIDANLSCEQGQLQLVTEPGNPLALNVTALIGEQGKYQLNGTMKPDASLPKEVHQAMQFVGQPDAEGRFTLKLQSN
ncbi:MAG: type II secretion system protein N [Gammaproteobacteria bacterium]|nr:type II secretion system protein N [Gammaproteobacteria bacterium]MBU2059220.1 type II secretion system protein N [Gammaproteobacteria bacterium]MBU2173771.1 type II secretion system protein N [Gammaproteobacteria bacterium]MBU2246927.1 type II secretion system protein N [Gammaproteobacteria bacterium]MBU2343497.1 type II secretion system protein N [Gammaproteobacteria bacterium]